MTLSNTDANGVPVIDLTGNKALVQQALATACRQWGFFHLIGHGFDGALLDAVMDQSRRFFDADAPAKRALSRTRETPWGYNDRELTKNRRDKKEIFDIGPDSVDLSVEADVFQGNTPFPDWQPELSATARAYFSACEDLCRRLLPPIAAGLGADPRILADAFVGGHTSFLRLNHYPTADLLADEGAEAAGLGIHQHSDSGAITVLLTDGRAGLEVLKDGAWIPVNSVPGGLIINIGDMVQVWSNDTYPAPLHRVQAMVSEPRLSLAYFFNPSYRAVIRPLDAVVGPDSPARYRDLSWSEFRRARADGDFADYGTEVQISDYRTG